MLYYVLRASRKNAVEAYKFLRLDKEKSIRLLNARYNAWIRFLAKESNTSPETISEIIKFSGRHGDKGLLKMLEALVMANARKDIQNELKSALMASWQSKGMPALNAFKLLKLDQQTNHKLYIKLLTMWAEYVKNAKLDMEAVIAGIDDKTSLKIIDDLKEIKSTEEVVKSLEDSLVKSWANTKPEDVVTTLLHGSNSNFDMWLKYVARSTDTSPATKSAIIKFSGRHGDKGLLKMLEALIMANAREDIQGGLKSALMASWQSKYMSARHVFKLLKLDQQADHKVYIKLLTMWAEYVKNAKLDMEAVIAGIDDKTSLKIIDDLKEIKSTEEVVKSLEDSLVKSWANTKPEDVVTTLLHGSNSNFDMWLKYVARSTDTSPATKSAIIKFSGRHGDKGLLKMLEALVMANAREDIQNELKSALMASWKSRKKSARHVFKLLKLDQQDDHKVYIKLLTMWAEYMKSAKLDMKAVIAGIDDNTSLKIIDDLKEIKGFEEVVKSLQDSRVKPWADTKPEDVVTMPQPDSKPNFDTLAKDVVEASDPLQVAKPLIAKFSERPNDEDIVELFDAFAKAQVGEDIQNELKSALMASWQSKGMPALNAFILLKLNQKSDHKLYIKRLTLWAEYMKNAKLDMKAVIAGIDDNTSLKIIEDLKEIKSTEEVVKSSKDSRVKSWADTKPEDVVTMPQPEDVVTMPQPDSKPNFDTLAKDVVEASDPLQVAKPLIAKFSERPNDEDIVELFDAFAKAQVGEDIQNELKSALMASWQSKGMPALNAFILLKLNQKSDHKLYIKRLTLWAEYMKNAKLDMKAVIAGIDDNTSLKIIEDLKEIKSTEEVVKSSKDSRVKSWADTKPEDVVTMPQPEDVVTMPQPDSKPNFDTLAKDVVEASDPLQVAKPLIAKFSERPNDEDIVELFDAFAKAQVGEDIQNELKSALMASWQSKGMPALNAFILLKLNQKSDHKLYIKRLTLWAEYMKNAKLDMKAVIAGIDDNTSLKIIEDLKEIKSTEEVVKSSKDSRVKSWADTKPEDVVTMPQPEDVVTMPQPDSKPNFDTLAKDVVEASDPLQVAKPLIAKFSERPNDEDIVELFDAFAKAQVGEDIQNELKSALMASWQSKGMPALNAFILLKLNQKSDHKLYIKRLTLWAEYMKNAKLDMKAVIAGIDDNTSLKIIEDLKEIKSTEEVVKSSKDSRVKSWADTKPEDVVTMPQPEDVVTMPQPDSKPNFDTLAKDVVEASDPLQVAKPLIAKFSKITNDAGLVEMFNAFAKAQVGEDIQNELKSALMTSWQSKKISALDVFILLKLDQQTDHKLYDKLLTMWVQYVKKITGGYSDINMGVVINNFDLDVRVTILGHLRHITGTAVVVENLEKTLVAQLQKRKGAFKEVVSQVFKDLNLDKDLNNLLHEPNLMLFNSFAEKFKPTPTKEVLITAARNVFLDKEVLLGEMLEFEWRKKDIATASGWRKKDIAMASELRLELFRQWYQTKRGLQLLDSMSQDLRSDYEGVIADPAIFNKH
ncbi:unnamed protein product [Peronospora effusa]|nr:unnamed protein product [Peronospora effusa]